MVVDRDRHLHDLMNFSGIRALPTAAGLLQLCKELHHAGIMDQGALERIKGVMERELALSLPQTHSKTDLEVSLRKHLDALFDTADQASRQDAVGDTAQSERS